MRKTPFLDFKEQCTDLIKSQNIDLNDLEISLVIPPRREFGDLSCNIAFLLSKRYKKKPQGMAQELVKGFDYTSSPLVERAEVAGAGYINFFLNNELFYPQLITLIQKLDQDYGVPAEIEKKNVIIEHTSVNPNKAWHIGHSRNAILGDVLGRLLRKLGHKVEIQNYIDDTGKQVADTIYAFEYFKEDKPDGLKFDHFLGDLYVRLHSLLRGKDEHPDSQEEELKEIERGIEGVMPKLERGDYREFVKRCLYSQLETAWRLNVFYDLLSWESDIVRSELLEEAMKKIKKSSHVYVAQDGPQKGCLVIDMDEFWTSGKSNSDDEYLNSKILIRSNGLPTYTAKDIAYQMWKFGLLSRDMRYLAYSLQPNGKMLWSSDPEGEEREKFKTDGVINVIGAEQSYTQAAVYAALQVSGYEKEYENSHHLAYGHVRLRDKRMSGRKGTGVLADDVIDQTVEEAYRRVKEKRGDELSEEEMREIAEKVGIGAIRYFMIQSDPYKEITFDINDVLNLEGNTSPYLQYVYVRTVSLLRKAREEKGIDLAALRSSLREIDLSTLQEGEERDLIICLSRFPLAIESAIENLSPRILTDYAYELSTLFNRFYRVCPVLSEEDENTKNARLILVDCVNKVMKNALNIIGIDLLEAM